MRNDRYGSLDGIKGFALIGIIWYHLSQRSLPGGFIGVDVFFTVSGFLLALSVLREIDRTGRLRLGNFYLRRLSRLWPAMAFMIAGSVSLGLFVNHDILVGVPGKSVSALTFTSNWGEIFSGDSYFAATSPQLLRHFWFVALLAQATLVLPLLTAMLHRIGSTFVQALVPVLLAALSACGMWVLYNPSADPTRVYFGTDTHCFGMLLGVALAFVVRHSEESDAEPRRLFTMVMPWLATGALVVLIMMMPRVGQDASAFRGGLILASVLTVVLIGGSISKDSWMIGLFVWHVPVALAVVPAAAAHASWLPWQRIVGGPGAHVAAEPRDDRGVMVDGGESGRGMDQVQARQVGSPPHGGATFGSATGRQRAGTWSSSLSRTLRLRPCPRRKTRRSSHPAAPVPRRRCAWSSPCRLWY